MDTYLYLFMHTHHEARTCMPAVHFNKWRMTTGVCKYILWISYIHTNTYTLHISNNPGPCTLLGTPNAKALVQDLWRWSRRLFMFSLLAWAGNVSSAQQPRYSWIPGLYAAGFQASQSLENSGFLPAEPSVTAVIGACKLWHACDCQYFI